MHFGLSDTQIAIAQRYAALLSTNLSGNTTASTSANAASARILVSAQCDGDGLGFLDFAVVAEQFGKAGAVPMSLGNLAAALTFGADATTHQAWLKSIANGAACFAVAFESGVGHTGQAHLTWTPSNVSGELDTIIDAERASHLLIFGRDAVARIARLDRSVQPTLRPSIDPSRSIARVSLTETAVVAITDTTVADRVMAHTVDAMRVALAAENLGAATTLLERSIAYAKVRRQFGREIGSYQGVKFACAEMAAMLEPCRALMWQAAYAIDHDRDNSRELACHTKAHVADDAREIARMAIELHGAYGFSENSGLHAFYRRIAANRPLLGGPEYCRMQAGSL